MRRDFSAPYPEYQATGLSKVDVGISGPQQTLLDTLAQFDAYGLHPLDRTTLAIQSGASYKSSGFRNNLSALKTKRLIDYPGQGAVMLTDAGRNQAKTPTKARTLAEFHSLWLAMVSGPQSKLLAFLISIYSRGPVSKEALAAACGMSENSSGYRNNLSALRSMGAIEYPAAGQVRASAMMFPKGVKS